MHKGRTHGSTSVYQLPDDGLWLTVKGSALEPDNWLCCKKESLLHAAGTL